MSQHLAADWGAWASQCERRTARRPLRPVPASAVALTITHTQGDATNLAVNLSDGSTSEHTATVLPFSRTPR